MALPPLPLQDLKSVPYSLQEWLRALQVLVGGAVGSIPWATIDTSGSNLTDIVTRLHSSLQSLQGGTSGQYYHLTSAENTTVGTLVGSTYTPTLTNVANVGASTAYRCQYMRVSNTVTVSGKLDIDPTTTLTLTQLGISLPVASNIGAAEDVGGVAFATSIAGQGAGITGDAANNRAQLEYIAGDVTNQPMCFTFTYQVI